MLSDDQFMYTFLDTKNELTEEVGGYEHVTVLRNIKVVDEDLVDALQNLPRGNVPGDCILNNYWIVIVQTSTVVKHTILFRVTVCLLSIYLFLYINSPTSLYYDSLKMHACAHNFKCWW